MRRNECSNANFVKSTVILKLIAVKRNLRARTTLDLEKNTDFDALVFLSLAVLSLSLLLQ
jgi:hypothetical protein